MLRSVIPMLAVLAIACESATEPVGAPKAQHAYWIDEGVSSDTVPAAWYTTDMGPSGGTTAAFEGATSKGHTWTKMQFGNYVFAKVKTTLRYGTATVGTQEGEAEYSNLIPFPNPPQKDAYANVTASKQCGHLVDVHGQHEVAVNLVNMNFVKVPIGSNSWTTSDSELQDACPPPPPPGEGDPCWGGGDTNVVSANCENCEWVEYGIFVYFDYQWWLVGDTWFEMECEEGPENNVLDGSPPGNAVRASRITLVLVPDAAFNGGGAASKIVRKGSAANEHAVIMLRESAATERELSLAYAGLMAWSQKDPERAMAGGQPVQISRSKPAATYAWAQDALTNLRQSQPSEVPGVGTYRAVDLQR